MKRRCLLLLPMSVLFLSVGCFLPGDQKVRAPEAAPKAAKKSRPVTADMVTPETAHRVVEQLGQDIEVEIGKE